MKKPSTPSTARAKSAKPAAVSTKVEAAQGLSPLAAQLNARQRLFCELYAGSPEHYGNGASAYAAVYGVENRTTAAVNASRLLSKANISAYVNEVRQRYITDDLVDFENAFVILQRGDLTAKNRAIAEYNKVRGRIIEKKEHKHVMLGLVRHIYDRANGLPPAEHGE